VCVGGGPVDAGTPCERDYDKCTIDACDGSGACVQVDSVTCDPCSRCDWAAGCVGDVQYCSSWPGRSTLNVRTHHPEPDDVVAWSWSGGGLTMDALGEPTAFTDYLLCAYAVSDDPVCLFGCYYPYRTIAFVDMPAGPAWTPTSSGFKYRATSAKAQLRAGTRSRFKVKSKSPDLGVPVSLEHYGDPSLVDPGALVTAPALVEFRGGGQCWSVQLDTVSKRTSTLLKAIRRP
jgi:hypothetical protein